ncbi:type II secretion system F family protein [uncultured Vibrio sp.]|uniref:type II secretion system F family protein n=1 Tax=uncultured Vibrio sp. TaxID=114054 RepID=UPI0009186C82|nr:type II secretion system F family protein [uncultured Vibrio sp.]OIQ25102.1 MAG: pilus assembly protein TadB [Vibrio sp. MedPE-SWchi]
MYWLIILGGAILMFVALKPNQAASVEEYLSQQAQNHNQKDLSFTQQAVNFASLSDRNFKQKVRVRWDNLQRQLGKMALAKVVAFSFVVVLLAGSLNQSTLGLPWFEVLPLALGAAWVIGYLYLQKREKKRFEETFPDALNMLASSLSAGESIGRGIGYVGQKLEGEVGKEFKVMSERLNLGEPIDDVFRKSCRRFPYPSFHFFVITLRANMQRGGQLKEVMSRLNRQMFEARAVERKKFALTSEARISAKIVGATPFFFLFILQFLSSENFEFVMHHPEGRPILYYLITSESIGMLIIWALMKKVK